MAGAEEAAREAQNDRKAMAEAGEERAARLRHGLANSEGAGEGAGAVRQSLLVWRAGAGSCRALKVAVEGEAEERPRLIRCRISLSLMEGEEGLFVLLLVRVEEREIV